MGQTIIVCGNTKEADKIRNIFAQKLPAAKKVMAYHSRSNETDAFEMFSNNQVDILVTVDMCIEAIDLPAVANIVLWRNMKSWRQYMQILGR